MQYNVVDSPAGVVPVTHVDPSVDSLPDGYWSSDKTHSTILSRKCEKIYDVHQMAGIPVGVQVSISPVDVPREGSLNAFSGRGT
jgi:hypothetical protein